MSFQFSLQGVGVAYGRVRALHEVALQIRAGERVALVGANGSGKSTLLRLLHGLTAPSAGVFHRDQAARQAMLFQRPHMLRMSAQNNVALGLWLDGACWKNARAQALHALERVGLRGPCRAQCAHAVGRPAAAAGAGRGPGRCGRTCCCSTSRPPAWTPMPSAKSRR